MANRNGTKHVIITDIPQYYTLCHAKEFVEEFLGDENAVAEIDYLKNQDGNKMKTNICVELKTDDYAQKLMKSNKLQLEFHGNLHTANVILARDHSPQLNDQIKQRALHCARIPSNMYNQSILQAHFARFGNVINLSVSPHPTKKFAVVEYDSHESASMALKNGVSPMGYGNVSLMINWFKSKNVSGNHSVQQFDYLPAIDNDVVEFIRRSRSHHKEFAEAFDNFAFAKLNGKPPEVVAQFQLSEKLKRNQRYSQLSFEKECIGLSVELFSMFNSQTEDFDQERLADVRKQMEWNRFNESITFKITENQQVSLFVRWNSSGNVKVVGLSQDVSKFIQWLRCQCDPSASPGSQTDEGQSSHSNSVENAGSQPNETFSQFEYALKVDSDIVEYVRRSHIDLVIKEFVNTARVELDGKPPQLIARFKPLKKLVPKTNNQLKRDAFESDCTTKINNVLEKFSAEEETFEEERLNAVRKTHEWKKYNDVVTVQNVSVFVRWNYEGSKGSVKVIGLVEDVDFFVRWLANETGTAELEMHSKSDGSYQRSPLRNRSMTPHGDLKPSESLQAFENDLDVDSDIVEFVRRSHFEMLTRDLRNFAKIELFGNSPEMKARFTPTKKTMSTTGKEKSQHVFKTECIREMLRVFAKFSAQEKTFEEDEVNAIRKTYQWKKFNDVVTVKTAENNDISVFVRWKCTEAGSVKVVGLLEDVVSFMQWLEQKIGSRGMCSKPNGTGIRRPSSSNSLSPRGSLTSSQKIKEFEYDLKVDNDLIEFVRRSPIHLADISEYFKDLARVNFDGKAPDMITRFKPVQMSAKGQAVNQEKFEGDCIREIKKYFAKFKCQSSNFDQTILERIRSENDWKKYNDTIKVSVRKNYTAAIFVRWNNPKPGTVKMVGLSKDVNSVTQWIKARSSATTQYEIYSEASFEILQAMGILAEISKSFRGSVEIEEDKDENKLSFVGSKNEVASCKHIISKQLQNVQTETCEAIFSDQAKMFFLKRAFDPNCKTEIKIVQAIKKALRESKIKALLQCVPDLRLVYDHERDLSMAAKSLNDCIQACQVPLISAADDIFQTRDWKIFQTNLWNSHAIFVTFIRGHSNLKLAGLKSHLREGRQKVVNFVTLNVPSETVFKLDYPVALHMYNFRFENGLNAKFKGIQWEMSRDGGGFSLTGRSCNVKEAKNHLEYAKKPYSFETRLVTAVGMPSYFREKRGKDYLRTVQALTKCLILIDTFTWSDLKQKKNFKPLVTVQLSGVSVRVIKADITEVVCDAIVNASNKELELRSAGVSGSILKKGGNIIQQEMSAYRENIGGELSPGCAITTTGSSLSCKKIIHAVGPTWNSTNSSWASQCLLKCIQACLHEAEKHRLNSIAIPAISCGVFGGEEEHCTHLIVQAIREYFSSNSKSNIQQIDFVEMKNQKIIDCFKKNLMENTRKMKSTITDQISKASTSQKIISPLPIFATSMVKASFSVTVKLGDILSKDFSDYEVIALPKGGQLSQQLVATIGQSTLQSFLQNPIIQSKNYVVSGGGNLTCKNIIHIVSPGNIDGTEKVLTEVFKAVDSTLRLKSLAIPAIGTGNAGLPSVGVAQAMRRAIECFKRYNPSYLKRIVVVTYDASMLADFQTALAGSSEFTATKNQETSVQDTTMASMPNHGKKKLSVTRLCIPEKTNGNEVDGIQLLLCSNKSSKIEEAWKRITEHVQEKSWTTTLQDNILGSLTDSEEDRLMKLEFQHHVQIRKISGSSGCDKIHISGLKDNVFKASNAANGILQKLKDVLALAELVTWKYFDHRSQQMRDFPLNANWQIEEDFKNKRGSSTICVNINQNRFNYRVDFASMNETCLETNAVVQVLRYSRTDQYPPHWGQITDGSMQIKCLSSNSTEYLDILQHFNASGVCGNVIKIESIQNPTLYNQFLAQKRKVEARMKSQGVMSPVSRQLFHGTSGDVCESIFKHGFDRSHAGKNATMYGRGVYFATTSTYSHRYTSTDFNGERKMFFNEVITGEYCQGHSLIITTPNKPGRSKADFYDSVVNNITSPSIFVVFKDASVYPSYLLTYV